MKQVELFDGVNVRVADVQKEKNNGRIVKVQISEADGKYSVYRTVYVDNNGERCVQIHMGHFVTLGYYENKGEKVAILF